MKLQKKITKEVTGQTKIQAIEGIMKKFQISLEDACDTIGWTVEQFLQAKGEQGSHRK